MKNLDVKHINPFIQSSISVIESVTQVKLAVGKPSVSGLFLRETMFTLQIGVTGVIKGQVFIVMDENDAKIVASRMMMGMPVDRLDDMAVSALCELTNMIMGNTATVFSTQGIPMDITPPLAIKGSSFKADAQALKVPLVESGKPVMDLFLCVHQEG